MTKKEQLRNGLDLAPCPICGNENIDIVANNTSIQAITIKCGSSYCGCQMHVEGEKELVKSFLRSEAIKRWCNRK